MIDCIQSNAQPWRRRIVWIQIWLESAQLGWRIADGVPPLRRGESSTWCLVPVVRVHLCCFRCSWGQLGHLLPHPKARLNKRGTPLSSLFIINTESNSSNSSNCSSRRREIQSHFWPLQHQLYQIELHLWYQFIATVGSWDSNKPLHKMTLINLNIQDSMRVKVAWYRSIAIGGKWAHRWPIGHLESIFHLNDYSPSERLEMTSTPMVFALKLKATITMAGIPTRLETWDRSAIGPSHRCTSGNKSVNSIHQFYVSQFILEVSKRMFLTTANCFAFWTNPNGRNWVLPWRRMTHQLGTGSHPCSDAVD